MLALVSGDLLDLVEDAACGGSWEALSGQTGHNSLLHELDDWGASSGGSMSAGEVLGIGGNGLDVVDGGTDSTHDTPHPSPSVAHLADSIIDGVLSNLLE